MDINAIIDQLRNVDLIYLFFKAFAIVFSLFYLIYALVLLKQTQVMNATLQTGGRALINLISFVQLLIGVLLVLLAIFVI